MGRGFRRHCHRLRPSSCAEVVRLPGHRPIQGRQGCRSPRRGRKCRPPHRQPGRRLQSGLLLESRGRAGTGHRLSGAIPGSRPADGLVGPRSRPVIPARETKVRGDRRRDETAHAAGIGNRGPVRETPETPGTVEEIRRVDRNAPGYLLSKRLTFYQRGLPSADRIWP